MTKKDYIKIASLVKRYFGVDEAWRINPRADWAIRLFVGGLIDHLKTTNPKFDEEKFKDACGF